MNKPVFKHSKAWFMVSAILTLPLLIDICTACHLFSLWIAWLLYILICIISIVRLYFAFKQNCIKFAWGLIGQLFLGGAVLIFFQLSYKQVIETPVSHPVTPAVVDITDPLEELDSTHKEDKKKDFSTPDFSLRQEKDKDKEHKTINK